MCQHLGRWHRDLWFTVWFGNFEHIEDSAWSWLCEVGDLCASTWGKGTGKQVLWECTICDAVWLECVQIEFLLGHFWVRLVGFVPDLGEMGMIGWGWWSLCQHLGKRHREAGIVRVHHLWCSLTWMCTNWVSTWPFLGEVKGLCAWSWRNGTGKQFCGSAPFVRLGLT